jgi:ClpP class serine protease
MFRRKYIKRIQLNKYNNDTIKILENKLNNLKPSNSHALFLNVGGNANTSLPIAISLTNLIKDFRKEKKIPVYTFAEEKLFGPTLLVLLSGDHVFSDRHTMFGLFDFSRHKLNFRKFLAERNLNVKVIPSGRHKIRLNPFEEFKPEDIEWAKHIMDKQKQCFVEVVEELRKDKLKAGVKELLNNDIFFGSNALEMGLIDGCGFVESVYLKNFPDKRIKNAKYKFSLGDFVNLFKNRGDVLSEVDSDLGCDIDNTLLNYENDYLEYVCQNSLKNNLL